jgi:hypothetical protein
MHPHLILYTYLLCPQQKLLVGDDSGTLSCYEFTKGAPQMLFQARPFECPISSIALGGNPLKRNEIYVSSRGQKIVGISKKGKEFILDFQLN